MSHNKKIDINSLLKLFNLHRYGFLCFLKGQDSNLMNSQIVKTFFKFDIIVLTSKSHLKGLTDPSPIRFSFSRCK